MPSASDAEREQMRRWFGDPVDLGPPYRFLMSHGYTEQAGMLIKPTPAYNVSADEWTCIIFLCHEWDYGFDPVLT